MIIRYDLLKKINRVLYIRACFDLKTLDKYETNTAQIADRQTFLLAQASEFDFRVGQINTTCHQCNH